MDAMSTERQVGRVRHLSEDHLTPTGVGKLAPRAQVKRVVLTHLMLTGSDDADRHHTGIIMRTGIIIYINEVKKFY